jgi:HlyB family type I secretion system ABC transporter
MRSASSSIAGFDGTASRSDALTELPILRFLPEETRRRVIESFVPVTFTFGTPIVREGEPADALFLIVSGRARVVKNADRGGPSNGEVSLGLLKAGDTFGEIGLLEQTMRTVTVRASSDVEALRLDRTVFDALVASHPDARRYLELQALHRRLNNFFKEYTAFAKLPAPALRELLDALRRVTVKAGEVLIRQGELPGSMYIVESGRLRAFRETDGRRSYISYIRKGDFFGEMSMFKDEPRAASVEAVSDCTLLALGPDTFAALIERHPEFRARIEERIAQYDYRTSARVPLDFADETLPGELRARDQVGTDQLDRAATSDAQTRKRAGPAGPFASDDGQFAEKGKRIRRFPLVYQIDEMDCGAACVAMICRHFGRNVSLARIRPLVHTSLDGSSLRALCEAATELGLAGRAVKASPKNFELMPLPAIIHWDGNHWVVLYHVSKTHAWIVDPAFGYTKVTHAELLAKWSGFAALFDYTEAFERTPEAKPGLAWLWPFLKPHLALIGKALGLAGIVSALQMVLPVFTQIIVDRVVVEQDRTLLGLMVGGMLGVLVFMTAATLLQRYLMSFVAVRLDSSTLDHLTQRLLALPMSYFSTRRTGDIQRRLEGMRHVREFFVQQGVAGLSAVIQLAATLLMMFVYSSRLTLVFLVTAPLYAGMMYFSARYLRPLFDKLEDAYGKYHSYQIDAIRGIETVKAMAAEGTFREVMLAEFTALSRRRFKADFTMMSYDGVVQVVMFLSVALFLFVGARLVMDGQMTIGALVAFNSLVALANAPIFLLLSMWDNLQITQLLLDRLNDVFAPEPEQGADRSRLVPVRSLEGRVSFQNMGFRYGGPDAPAILDGISLDVPAGKMVAIVGRSGSGKTTLIKCLAGLLEPTEGTIRYDGVELKTLNYRDLRRQVGFVLQENHLFNDTIARNIAFGEAEPDMDGVIWAARLANADEFIARFPLGYETKVGESGLGISGGQRQRIAIARAVYHRPPILVFDEATSALDTESERAVKDNMTHLLAGRTSFVIAHRLSTVRDADIIVVLEQGRIVEQGTHDDLMQHQGLYYYLVSQQLGM